MSARGWYGAAPFPRKTVSPPFRPRTYPHLTSPVHTEPRRLGQPPAMVVVEGQATERIVGEKEVAVEVDPVGERRDRGGGRDADGRLFHAAKERPEPELVGAPQHARRRMHAAALGELDVDALDDADQRLEVLDRHARLVCDDRER